MRVVFDTNVFVSFAITPRGAHRDRDPKPRTLLRARRQSTTATPRSARPRHPRAGAELIDNPADIPALTRDPNDDYIVALARSARVDLVISDPDLQAEQEQCPPVISARDLLTRLDRA